jgi:hypothetical protein
MMAASRGDIFFWDHIATSNVSNSDWRISLQCVSISAINSDWRDP